MLKSSAWFEVFHLYLQSRLHSETTPNIQQSSNPQWILNPMLEGSYSLCVCQRVFGRNVTVENGVNFITSVPDNKNHLCWREIGHLWCCCIGYWGGFFPSCHSFTVGRYYQNLLYKNNAFWGNFNPPHQSPYLPPSVDLFIVAFGSSFSFFNAVKVPQGTWANKMPSSIQSQSGTTDLGCVCVFNSNSEKPWKKPHETTSNNTMYLKRFRSQPATRRQKVQIQSRQETQNHSILFFCFCWWLPLYTVDHCNICCV